MQGVTSWSLSPNATHVMTTAILAAVIGGLLFVIYSMNDKHTKAMVIVQKDFLQFMRTRPVVRVKVNTDKDTVYQPAIPLPVDAETQARRDLFNRVNTHETYAGVPS